VILVYIVLYCIQNASPELEHRL